MMRDKYVSSHFVITALAILAGYELPTHDGMQLSFVQSIGHPTPRSGLLRRSISTGPHFSFHTATAAVAPPFSSDVGSVSIQTPNADLGHG